MSYEDGLSNLCHMMEAGLSSLCHMMEVGLSSLCHMEDGLSSLCYMMEDGLNSKGSVGHNDGRWIEQCRYCVAKLPSYDQHHPEEYGWCWS